MPRRLALAASALLAFALTACPAPPKEKPADQPGDPAPADPAPPALAATPPAPEPGAPYTETELFPAFTGKTVKDEPFDLASHYGQGKYILVDFWAAWCGPCMADLPNMVRAMKENQNDRFEIVTVSFDDAKSKADLERVIAENELTFPIVTEWARWESSWVDGYDIKGIPANFLLDPSGKVLMRDLHGEDLVTITKQFSERTDLAYEPITMKMEILNPPAELTDEKPDAPVEPLNIKMDVWNPQVPAGTFQLGVDVVAYVDTGVQTLRKKADGTYSKDSKTGEPLIYYVSKVEKSTTTAEGENGVAQTTLTVQLPPGTMDIEVIPFAYSPTLGMKVTGKGEYPSYTKRFQLTDDTLATQGGVISPELAEVEVTKA